MRIPGAEKAFVDLVKLRDYCLNPHHPRGRHKARIFAERLGLTAARVEFLRDALILAVRQYDAAPGEHDGFGRRFVVEFPMKGSKGIVVVRSLWIVREGEDFPRLTSCYVA